MRIKLADELIEFQDSQQADHVCKLTRATVSPADRTVTPTTVTR
jgi:hypothetical protein